jgi:hypothetical protein
MGVGSLFVSGPPEAACNEKQLYLPRPMNALIVGSNKQPLLQYLPRRDFLLIDDGPLIDAWDLPRHRVFDVAKHSFNPLKDMDYRRAREFVGVLDAVFPEGESTLTARRSRFQILEALLAKPRTLDRLISDTKDTEDAYQKIRTLLLSPVLERVLNGGTDFSIDGTIVARLDRAVLGDFDCFVLANLLVSQYQGTVVIPDFGFYATRFHVSLIRQNRLVAGINSFDEVQDLKSQLVLIETKVGSRCTPDDAEILAMYAGITPGTNGYNDFIQARIGRA